MKCEKCGKEIDHVKISMFERDGSDIDMFIDVLEDDFGSVIIETNQNWCGYELTEEEQMEDIKCPHCNEFPFKQKEVQVYDVVKVVCFKSEVAENE